MSRRFGRLAFDFLRLSPVARRLTGRSPLAPGAARRWLFFRLARRYTPLIATEEADGAQFIIRTSDAVAGELLFVHGGSEDREVLDRAFRVIAARHGVQSRLEKPLLLEVGANIGTTTVAALRSGHVNRVIAIEAHPGTARLLRQNLLANDVAERVTVINAAVTDQAGEAELALSETDSGDHRVRVGQSSRSGELAGRSTMTVPATTLDALTESGEVNIDEVALVWIDAQGHEPRILAGAQSLLASQVPVLLEYWPQGLRASDGLEHLEELLMANYSQFIDLRAGSTNLTARPTSEVRALRAAYRDDSFTDILLMKG